MTSMARHLERSNSSIHILMITDSFLIGFMVCSTEDNIFPGTGNLPKYLASGIMDLRKESTAITLIDRHNSWLHSEDLCFQVNVALSLLIKEVSVCNRWTYRQYSSKHTENFVGFPMNKSTTEPLLIRLRKHYGRKDRKTGSLLGICFLEMAGKSVAVYPGPKQW